MRPIVALLFLVVLSSSPCTAEEFNWSEITPFDFLDILKDNKGNTVFLEKTNLPPEGWITEKDARMLIRVIESQEPVAPVAISKGPFVPRAVSTIGNEAMFLLEGFKAKKYPPTACSVYDFKSDPSAYMQWWNERAFSKASKTGIGAFKSTQTAPTREEILEDSKPATLSIIDALLFKQDTIRLGSAKIGVLVSWLTDTVEYVWSPPYKRYVRPKFVMPGIQKLYDRRRI